MAATAGPIITSEDERLLTIASNCNLTLYMDAIEISSFKIDFPYIVPDRIPLPFGLVVIAVEVTLPKDRPFSPMVMATDSVGLLRDSVWRCVAGNVTSDWMRREVDCSSWPEAVALDRNTGPGSMLDFDGDEVWFGVSKNNTDDIFCRIDLRKQLSSFEGLKELLHYSLH